MTKHNAKEYLPLVQALAEGKTIQWDTGKWVDHPEPDFTSPASCYRIKPEPREWFVLVNEVGHIVATICESTVIQRGCTTCHVREVLS